MEQDQIKEQVRERYGAHARRVAAKDDTGDCCEPASSACCDAPASSCCEPETLETARRLYTEGETEGLPTESVAASAGCGNPTALAGLRPGERVLDLGSGGGLDCFLAARQVGETGSVTGLDMTPEMLELARNNQASLGLTNVEFVQGEMESMPLPGDSFDVIISNCVVCLSPDKDAVFGESFRVLAPGGRIHLSDVLGPHARPRISRLQRGGLGGLRRGSGVQRGLRSTVCAAPVSRRSPSRPRESSSGTSRKGTRTPIRPASR